MAGGFDIVALQDAIVEKVKLTLPNTIVFEDTIPDDANLPRDENGKLSPYVYLRFGPIKAARRGKSFMGPRHDEYFGTLDVASVASNGRIARRMEQVLVDALIGFRPDGVNPMSLRSDEGDPSQFVVTSNEARPTQNVASTRMRFGANTVNVGASPTP